MGDRSGQECREGRVVQAGERAASAYAATLVVPVIIANKGAWMSCADGEGGAVQGRVGGSI